MKKIFKILLILVIAVAVVIGVFLSFIAVKGIPTYEPKVVEVKIEHTPERVVQGKRLAAMLCVACHYDPETNRLSGKYSADLPPIFGKIYSKNITQHEFYGIGKWTDGDLMYFLRTGVRQDGTYAPGYMPKFVMMSDEDMYSIISWLRSDDERLATSDKQAPLSEPSLFTKILCNTVMKAHEYPTQPVLGPDTTDDLALGKYIALGQIACFACHSKDFADQDFFHPEKSLGFFGGSNPMRDEQGNLVYSANITPDPETGIGNWTEEEFIKAVRFSQGKNGSLRYPMVPHTQLTDHEVACIYKYLKTVPPIKNKVDRTATN